MTNSGWASVAAGTGVVSTILYDHAWMVAAALFLGITLGILVRIVYERLWWSGAGR